MDEHGHSQPVASLEDGEEPFFIQIQVIDIGSDLYATHADAFASLQFLHRKFGILHRDGAQTQIVLRMCLNQLHNMIIEELRNVEAVVWLCPVRKHYRNGAYYL